MLIVSSTGIVCLEFWKKLEYPFKKTYISLVFS